MHSKCGWLRNIIVMNRSQAALLRRLIGQADTPGDSPNPRILVFVPKAFIYFREAGVPMRVG